MAFDAEYLVVFLKIGEKTIKIGGFDTPYQLLQSGIEGITTPETVQTFGEHAQLDGSYLISRRVAAREISLAFEICDREFQEQHRANLLRFFAPKIQGTLTVRRGRTERSIGGMVIGAPVFYQETLAFPVRVQVKFFCCDPYFYGKAVTAELKRTSFGLLAFPLTMMPDAQVTGGLRTISREIFVRNEGDAPAGFTFTMTAQKDAAGTCLLCNPAIRLRGTGETVRVLGTLRDGDTLLISTVPGKKEIRLNDRPHMRFERESLFFSLPPGEAVVDVLTDGQSTDGTKESGSFQAALNLRPRYFGI